MRIATWNVNSLKQRLDHVRRFLDEAAPDVLCLQELKSTDEAVPVGAIEASGYRIVFQGQKAFNGVAILSRQALQDVRIGLPGDDSDEQARYIEGVVRTSDDGPAVRVACLYLPNGNPTGTPKYDYKLAWMARLHAQARKLLADEVPLVLAGDYNVIPDARDVDDPAAWTEDALYRPATREAFRALLGLGLTDALRACDDDSGRYTFWDYQAGAWQRNKGIRIDHLLLSPQAADRLAGVEIHKNTRAWEKPSDHVPVSAVLDI